MVVSDSIWAGSQKLVTTKAPYAPFEHWPHAADVQEISLDQLDASFRQRLGGVALGVAYRDTRSKSPPSEQCVDDASTLRSRTAEHSDQLVCHVHLLLWSDLRVSPLDRSGLPGTRGGPVHRARSTSELIRPCCVRDIS